MNDMVALDSLLMLLLFVNREDDEYVQSVNMIHIEEIQQIDLISVLYMRKIHKVELKIYQSIYMETNNVMLE